MLRKPIALILGAGASRDLGFPLGDVFLRQIADALDQFSGGSAGFLNALVSHKLLGAERSSAELSATLLRRILNTGKSIDLLIHRRRDDVMLGKIGKLCIARLILEAEARAAKTFEEAWKSVPFRVQTETGPSGYWLHNLLEGVTRGLQRGKTFENDLKSALSKLGIVTFNYDRSVEFFVGQFLERAFELDRASSFAFVRDHLPICHIYGLVDANDPAFGPLQLQFPTSLEPGSQSASKRVVQAAESIRTIYEAEVERNVLATSETILSRAQSVLLIGNSFIPENFKLVGTKKEGTTKYYATCLSLPPASVEQARRLVSECFGSGALDFRSNWTAWDICADLLDMLCE